MEKITSLQNPRVKALVRLHNATHRRKRSAVLIEGTREVSRAIKAEIIPREVYICPELHSSDETQHVLESLNLETVETFELTETAFRKASLRENPDGLIVITDRPVMDLDMVKLPENPLLVLA